MSAPTVVPPQVPSPSGPRPQGGAARTAPSTTSSTTPSTTRSTTPSAASSTLRRWHAPRLDRASQWVRTRVTGGEGRPLTTGRLLGWGLILPGVLLLAFALFVVGISRFQADRAQDLLYGDITRDLGLAVVPVSGTPAPGTPLGVLSIDEIGMRQVFVQGSTSEETAVGPGLRRGSVLPGQAGNATLVGRRATFGAPFRHLDELSVGDKIKVTTGQGVFHYVVDLVRTSNQAASTIPSVASRLTMVTADPALTPSRQLVVSAALKGDAQPASFGSQVVPDDAPGEGTRSRTGVLVLWAFVLVGTAVAATAASLRFRKRIVWVGALPLVVAVLWHVYENLALLLPNTL